MASLIEASRSGDVAAVRAAFEGEQTQDINAVDEAGQSALMAAVKGGHQDVVQELLSRGADRNEALAQGFGQSGTPIADQLNEAGRQDYPAQEGHQEGEQQQQMYAPVPTDIYGGYQLPDGSIAYGGYPAYPAPYQAGPQGHGQPAFYHDPVMFPHHQMPYPFPPQQQQHHANGPRQQRPSFNGGNGHVRKPSAVGKLPPADVAKQIPCRFYPNCRNGSSCIFAHIDMPEGQADQGHPQGIGSPNGYPHHPAPNFYGSPNGMYGNGMPQPFYPMAYGPPMPLHYQPHEPSQPGQMTPIAPQSIQQQQSVEQDKQQTSEASPAVGAAEVQQGEQQEQNQSAANGVTTEESSSKAVEGQDGEAAGVPSSSTASLEPNDASSRHHRKQSFNSFLHSHAVPFQPSQMSSIAAAAVPIPLGPAAYQQHHAQNGFGYGHQPFTGAGRGKPRGGRGGMNGLTGERRSRNPCTFFAKNACKYGSDCHYPHLLPDGTDARRLPGSTGPAQAHAAASSSTLVNGNGQEQPRQQDVASEQPTANGVAVSAEDPQSTSEVTSGPSSTQVNGSSTASLGSQAAKKAAGLPPTPSAEVTVPASDAASAAVNGQVNGHKQDNTSSSTSKAEKTAPGPNGFIPSKPSATAMAEAAAAAAAAAAGNKSSPSVNGSKAQSSAGQPSAPRKQANGKTEGKAANGNNATNRAKKGPTQRVPSGADFPALSGSQSTTGVSSPALTASESMDGSVNGSSSSTAVNGSSSAAPKINFSAILSAPAPVKKASEPVSTAPAATANGDAATTGDKAEESSEQNGTAKPTINGHAQGNGTATPPAASKDTKSRSSRPATSSTNGAKPWGTAPAAKGAATSSLNTTSATASTPTTGADEADEDGAFQLVKGRNHGKKTNGPANGARGGFAAVAKAAVAA